MLANLPSRYQPRLGFYSQRLRRCMQHRGCFYESYDFEAFHTSLQSLHRREKKRTTGRTNDGPRVNVVGTTK